MGSWADSIVSHTLNSAAMNMGVQVSQLYANLHFFEYVPRSILAG
jgi:hypothetical protein